MHIVFLPSARVGLRWFHKYYTDVFTDGKANADRQFLTMKKVLLTTPDAGRPMGVKNFRIYSIPRTPFSVIYRVEKERVEILKIYDQRSEAGPGEA